MSEQEKPGRPAHEVSDVSTETVVKFGLGLLTSMVSRRRTVGLPEKVTRIDQIEVVPLRQAAW